MRGTGSVPKRTRTQKAEPPPSFDLGTASTKTQPRDSRGRFVKAGTVDTTRVRRRKKRTGPKRPSANGTRFDGIIVPSGFG